MTENKRFNPFHQQMLNVLEYECIYDNVENEWLSIKNIVNLLNQLNDENECLREIMGFMPNDNANDILNVLNYQESDKRKLQKENEQLKKENEELKKDRFICLDCEHSGYTEIGCLCEYTDNWQEHITECEDFKELQE